MARNDKMIEVDGDAFRLRRDRLGMTRAEVAAQDGSPSESTWEVVENNKRPQFAERTIRRMDAVLTRLEASDAPMVLVRESDLQSALAALQDLVRRVEALESQNESPS